MEKCMVEENKCHHIFSLLASIKMTGNSLENYQPHNSTMKEDSKIISLMVTDS